MCMSLSFGHQRDVSLLEVDSTGTLVAIRFVAAASSNEQAETLLVSR